MTHTPGPWEIEKSEASSTGSVHYAVKTGYKPAEHPHSPRFVVFMCGGLGDFHPSRKMNDYRSDPQIEADVQLIAASPDMLAALRCALVFAENELECRERGYLPDGDEPYLVEAKEAVKTIRAAIAKATEVPNAYANPAQKD